MSFGEAPTPSAPRRRTIEQDSPPACVKGTATKSTTRRRRSTLANSLTPASARQASDRKGKGRASDVIHSDEESSQTTTKRGSFREDDSSSVKENEGRDERTVRDAPMDLVTSISTGSLMHQAMEDVDTQPKKPKRRRAGPRVALHVEVALKASSTARTCRTETVKKAVVHFIEENFESLLPESQIVDWDDLPILAQYVDCIRVAECSISDEAIPLSRAKLHIHVYRPSREYIIDSFSAAAPGEDDGGDGEAAGEDNDVMAATVAHLPAMSLEGIWDNLIYEDNVKLRLLNYINSTQLFGDRMVDFNVITWNRVVLLHGPPGTGKTSLCRALAQKLAIRLSDRYTSGRLVEINSHSIMSKWFSESGKLVQRLFTKVLELVDDENCFVVVLIDEVESLTSARAGAMSGKEPSDAVRVVNALLTQLDKLKNRKNVLVLTTSNLSGAIDPAFIDRADIKQYIGLPPVQAVYWILLGCLRELMRSGVMCESDLLDWKSLQLHANGFEDPDLSARTLRNSKRLSDLAHLCHGTSGRTLRRLPLLAHARYSAKAHMETDLDSVETWIEAMLDAVKAEQEQMNKVEENSVYL
ncbi:AAA-domain-containing protein [Cystobasidium minutum MCA 4210]|uniref:AAA-domain-containing protein n=1 Tax=Cystobasidium minutum MCA 4210 TaxID=1397322 RepID=UPI0034CDB6D5|eukprot:jgi/Rhomi1/156690/estExt_Genewise1Plus.C_1_t10337